MKRVSPGRCVDTEINLIDDSKYLCLVVYKPCSESKDSLEGTHPRLRRGMSPMILFLLNGDIRD